MRKLLAITVLAGSLAAMTACSAPSVFGGGFACASWVAYESDE